MSYPQSDSTNSDIQKSFFKAGIVSFNDDYNSIETNREIEGITRFNSIVKTSGIASEKRETESLVLFPSIVSGNQISITAGTGYTRNGARITIPLALSVLDVTALTNYEAPTSNKSVYIVLRKKVEEYQNRTHPITGATVTTRQRIKSDNSIVECVVDEPSFRESILESDKDIIVLGRLMSVSPVVLDTTENIGGRKILRTTENRAVEVTGANMEGNLNMQDIYNLINSPQFGKNHYSLEGSTHNRDFTRLFSRINYTLGTLQGIKFTQSTSNWGIQFANTDTVKIAFIPNQRPPKQININSKNSFLTIPENNVLYLQLSDTDILLTSGQSTITINLNSREYNDFFKLKNFLNTVNLGDRDASLLRFPIAYHYIDPQSNERKLLFANGFCLNANEEIDSNGKYSGYVRRDGGNVMIGDLTIEKSNATINLRRNSENLATITKSGITWTDSLGETINGRLVRLNSLLEADTQSSDTIGDIQLDVYNNQGTEGKKFIFKLDGRIVVPTAPSEDNDVVRLLELDNAYNFLNDSKYDKVGGVISGDVTIVGNLDSTGNVLVRGISKFNDTVSIFQDIQDVQPEVNYSKIILDNRNRPSGQGYNTMVFLRGYDNSLVNDIALVNNSGISPLTSSTGEIIGSSVPYIIKSMTVPDILSTFGSILITCTINIACNIPSGGVIEGGLRSPNGNIIQKFYIDRPPHPVIVGAYYSTVSFTKIIRKRDSGANSISGIYRLELLTINGSSVNVLGASLVEGTTNQTHMEYVILT
jgi:hypothetical protein